MINKFCRSKAIRHICAMFLISILAFVTIGAASQTPSQSARQISTKNKNTPISAIAISNYLAAQQNADLNDEEKIKTAIDAYFTLRYEGQKSIMEQNFSSLIEDSTLDWVKKEKDKREIELYIASLFDLGYQSYKFILDYDSIEIENDKAVVLLKQSHQVVYKAVAPQISELSGLPHIITLHSKNGVWSIYKDEYEDEYTRLIETTPKEKIKQQVDENYKFSRENDSAILEEAPANPKVNPLYYGSFAYNSAAAVIFADNYASSNSSPAPIPQAIKNAYQATYGSPYPSSWPQNYKVESDTDCANFVSQAIFEGTGYQSGDTNYFNPTPNDNNWYYKFSPTAQGSTTWVRVGAPSGSIAGLYNFLLNTNPAKRGPYGSLQGTCCLCSSIFPGDPILMKSGSTWQHVVIVSSKSYPCSFSNILVDSHTSYYKKQPLTTWSAYAWSGVHIEGYVDYTFDDVTPFHWAIEYVERLYNSGITGGCSTNPMNYCPDSTVTRAQMAVFLLRGIHGSSYIPPAVGSSTGFNDVPTNYWVAAWIKQFYAEGITGGCSTNPMNYCPEGTATFAQMAVFLLRSKYGSGYTPPPVGGSTGFQDVPTNHWAAAWIKQLVAEGIYSGCVANQFFCPENNVTRADMAFLLVNTFNLP